MDPRVEIHLCTFLVRTEVLSLNKIAINFVEKFIRRMFFLMDATTSINP